MEIVVFFIESQRLRCLGASRENTLRMATSFSPYVSKDRSHFFTTYNLFIKIWPKTTLNIIFHILSFLFLFSFFLSFYHIYSCSIEFTLVISRNEPRSIVIALVW